MERVSREMRGTGVQNGGGSVARRIRGDFSERTPDNPPPGILTQDFNTNTLRTSNSRTTEPELVSVSQDPGESITRIMPDPEAESGVAPAH